MAEQFHRWAGCPQLYTHVSIAALTYDGLDNPTNPNTDGYGWLGGKTRAQTDVGGLVLMGVGVYDPASGRFLQTDPVPGGSANNYDYAAQDPINKFDLSGQCWQVWRKRCHKFTKYVRAGVELPVSAAAATWASTVGHADCLHWNNTRAMIVCRGGNAVSGGLKGGTTYGSTFITQSWDMPDDRRMRHESKHANQWLIPGFPLLYGEELARTGLNGRNNIWERQAGLHDGCYEPRAGC